MEAHPVPQNVTNFEFHLIGDMTMKQFGYLTAGVGTAYVLFLTLSRVAPLVVWPLIVFFALAGVAFAFLPIMERPLDHWVGAYFKAIFQPTQRAWRFQNSSNKDPLFLNRLSFYLSNMQRDIYREQKGSSPKVSILSQMAPTTQPMVQSALAPNPTPAPNISQPPPTQPAAKLPSPQELEQTVELAKKAQEVQTKIVSTEELLNQVRAKAAQPGADPAAYTQESQAIVSQLQNLATTSSEISGQIESLSHSGAPAQQSAPKRVVQAANKQVQTNIVLTSTPNIINGIVTDSLNNYLEGAIVVTHDKQGLPVRALKTNKLGQFVAATPLPNGAYKLSMEKENLVFDEVEVTLDGQVLAPMVLSARKGGLN